MRRKRHWSYTGEKRRLRVLLRDNYECQIRGPQCEGTANTVDHIHPKAWGGTEDESNLRAACWPCNQRKGARATTAQPRTFFSSVGHRRAPLLKLPPHRRWGAPLATDYSRKAPDDGGSAA